MAMVSVVYWQPLQAGFWLANQLGSNFKGRQPPGSVLHSSHETNELLQCFKHYYSTAKIILILLHLHVLLLIKNNKHKTRKNAC